MNTIAKFDDNTQRNQLRAAYHQAIKNKEREFRFNGLPYTLEEAKILLECLDRHYGVHANASCNEFG